MIEPSTTAIPGLVRHQGGAYFDAAAAEEFKREQEAEHRREQGSGILPGGAPGRIDHTAPTSSSGGSPSPPAHANKNLLEPPPKTNTRKARATEEARKAAEMKEAEKIRKAKQKEAEDLARRQREEATRIAQAKAEAAKKKEKERAKREEKAKREEEAAKRAEKVRKASSSSRPTKNGGDGKKKQKVRRTFGEERGGGSGSRH